MSEVPEIINLAQVVEPHLDGGKLLSYTSRYLTKPGENYGSIMLALNALIKRPTGDIVELPLVAKLPPITNDLYWQIFHPERTCVTENTVYQYLSSALQDLQLEAGIAAEELFDGLPRYYGSRISLDVNATKVDKNAVLVQENLQTSGYKAGNRHKMFDFDHALLVLKYMAQYHALPIALRLFKPEVYEKYIRPNFKRFSMNETMAPEVQQQFKMETFKDLELATNNNLEAIERVKKLFDRFDEWQSLPDIEDGPYSSLVHSDMWINNLMIQYDEEGKPHKLKIVDFQVAQYESVAHDLIFFLFSSVDAAVLEESYEKLLKIYYDNFIHCLERVNVPIKKYSYEGFLREVKCAAPIQMPHVMIMTKIILADSSTMPENFKDVDMSVFSKNSALEPVMKRLNSVISLAEKYKLL